MMKVNMKKSLAAAVVSTAFLMAGAAQARGPEVLVKESVGGRGGVLGNVAVRPEVRDVLVKAGVSPEVARLFEEGTLPNFTKVVDQLPAARLNDPKVLKSIKVYAEFQAANAVSPAPSAGFSGSFEGLRRALLTLNVPNYYTMLHGDKAEERIANVIKLASDKVLASKVEDRKTGKVAYKVSITQGLEEGIKVDQGVDSATAAKDADKMAQNIQSGCYLANASLK